MTLRNVVTVLLLLAFAGPSLAQTAPDKGVEYSLVIACPGVQDYAGYSTSCPIRAVDSEDAMGDPSIAVDPDRPENLIIASLHGSGDSNGPAAKSRSGQAFTTFTSTNHGASWWDNPFTPPDEIGFDAYGEHPAVTIDPYGHVFVGSLYAVPAGGDRYDSVIAAQKFRSLDTINSEQDGSFNADYLGPVHAGNRIRQMWFLFNPITDNMTMVWTEQTTAWSGEAEGGERVGESLEAVLPRPRGEADVPASDGAHRTGPIASWNGGAARGRPTAAADQAAAADEPRSVIGVVWTGADLNTSYEYQPGEEAIGPCETSTNPVLSEGLLYIGCKVADEGTFRWNPGTRPGTVEMFRMDPDGGTPEYIGASPVVGGKPKLGVRSDGRMALLTADVEDGKLRLDGAYGQYDPATGRVAWGAVQHYGGDVESQDGPELRDANVQDMIYREYSGVLHLVLKQVLGPASGPALTARLEPTLDKAVVAIDEKHGFLAELDLDVGAPLNRSQDPVLLSQSDAVFNDISDDFLELPPGPFEYQGKSLGASYQREFIAVADYGIVLFAEVIERTNLRGPAPPGLPDPPPPPNPAPAPAATPAAATAGALTTAALLAGSVAIAKRKHTARDPGRRR